jgi:hypothetical protein
MFYKNPRGLRNRLLNRVRRHASITTIFRAVDPVQYIEAAHQRPNFQPPDEFQNDENLVQASLQAFSFQPNQSMQVSKYPTPPRQQINIIKTNQKSSDPDVKYKPSKPESFQVENGEEKPENIDDDKEKSWQQLKTIHRLHREKKLKKNQVEQPNLHSTNQIQRDKANNSKSNEVKSTQQKKPSDIDNAPNQIDDDGTPISKESDNSYIPETMVEPSELETSDEFVVPSGRDELETDSVNGQSESEISELQNEIQDETIPSKPILDGNVDSDDNFDGKSSTTKELGSSELGDEVESSSPIQSVPLEDAWPVKRQLIEDDLVKSSSAEGDNQTISLQSDIITPIKPRRRQVGIDTIQDALSRVDPNRPTKSSIELIPPNRPRPNFQTGKNIQNKEGTTEDSQNVTETQNKEDLPQSDSTVFTENIKHESTKQSVDKSSAEPEIPRSHHHTGFQPETTKFVTSKDKPNTQNLIQKDENPEYKIPQVHSSDKTKSTLPGRAIETKPIQTGIGPLPSDLWHLLNHDPPPVGKDEGKTPESQGQISESHFDLVSDDAVFRNEYPQNRHSPKPNEISDNTSSVQRSVTTGEAGSTTTTTSSSGNPGETSSEEATTQNAGPDINELSRRVYSEIRQKIMVEWERSRLRK